MVRGTTTRVLQAFLPSLLSLGRGPLRPTSAISISPICSSAAIASAVPSPGPRWLQDLTGSLRKNKEAYDKYVQLATVTPEGKPAVRTVVFRGFLEAGKDMPDARETLTFITDSRSNKMNDCLDAEVCWYLTGTREQFRLSGTLQMITERSESAMGKYRTLKWQNLSDNARKQFLWPHPGQPRPKPCGEVQDRKDFDEVYPDEAVPPSTFVLVLLHPDRVDHLRLKGFPQRRTLYERKEMQTNGRLAEWVELDVNP